jgi:hypothetical protein
MKLMQIPLPEVALLSITRVAVGAGLGLLLGPMFDRALGRKLGAVLLGAGALVTIPLVIDVIRRTRRSDEMFSPPDMPAIPTGRNAGRGDVIAH